LRKEEEKREGRRWGGRRRRRREALASPFLRVLKQTTLVIYKILEKTLVF
jgi:hypothetical protein